ncbi:putative disease resistance protein RGA1 [Morella rubra]|uniref:Putative disease resistance protein RGA1 n=1 Tax=Morella rubra TaxID=262757 RepID=A0A6A1UH88_9ROSI|nr:putative disease resistance protein RGA1 [Morella rubra]
MLINLWIAQGFIKPADKNGCLEDIANDYFMELLWRSFFQEAQTDELGDIDKCKMHDFMHDLAIEVSGSSFTTFDSENKPFDESKTHHVAIGDHIDSLSAVTMLFSKASMSLTEETLIAIFSSLKLLRTLDLHCTGIDVVPGSVSKSKHLRYLDLSGNSKIKKLPDSITRLQNLHTLRLRFCKQLEELPRDIKKFINLRHLEIDGCDCLTCMPRGLGQLTNLMTLSVFVVNSGGGGAGNSGGLDELNGLNSLREKLEIRGLVHGKDVASGYKAVNLKDKQHIHTLELKWTYKMGETEVDDEMQLEGLKPHSNLKKLSLEKFRGVRFPNNWLLSLTNLVSVRLESCKKLTYLPSLSQLTSLNSLTLMELDDLEYIEDSNMVSSSSSTPIAYFPSLKEMQFNRCPKLKGWCRRMDSLAKMMVTWMEDYPLLPSFPLLSKLTFEDCPMLTSIPTFPHLERLHLFSASWKPLQQTMMMNVASSPTPLSELKSLALTTIKDLRSLPEEGLRNLISIQYLSIDCCYRLETLFRGIQHLTALQTLGLLYCDELDLGKEDDWMQEQGLKSLHTLTIEGLPKLVSLPEGLRSLTSLQYLSINSCKRLETLSRGIKHLIALQTLKLRCCDELDLGKDDHWMQGKGLRASTL